MNLLIVGNKGQLGNDLMRQAPDFGFEPRGVDLPECDVTRWDSVIKAFDSAGPLDAVINAAAYTAVDAAESDVDTAFAVNRDGAGYVARACRQKDLPVIQVSTDYVFDGLKTTSYLPDDPIGPISVYGASKAEGEAAVRRETGDHLIVRTAWLFGLYGENFVKTIIRAAREKIQMQVVDDQVGCPTYSGDLAVALLKAAATAVDKKTIRGTFHYCNSRAATWYAFAKKIIELANDRESLTVKEVLPILSSQYPQPARRPPCTILDCTSFEKTFGIKRRSWIAALGEMIDHLYSDSHIGGI
jgi:dTDP-4-dehydrorhamnose reductase